MHQHHLVYGAGESKPFFSPSMPSVPGSFHPLAFLTESKMSKRLVSSSKKGSQKVTYPIGH